MEKKKKGKVVSYNKWGYIFLIPFMVVYVVFQLIPLFKTVYYSFFEYYINGSTAQFTDLTLVWFDNYVELLFHPKEGLPTLFGTIVNTAIMWFMGFVPQILVSLLLGAWFSDTRLRLKCSGFFKSVIYLPNLIMASAMAMLFNALFANTGPINTLLLDLGILTEEFAFMDNTWAVRIIVAFMNFLMWFGNTTILLMAGMMGIDASLFEAAEVDGATSTQVFWRITLPLLRPILVYVMITSLIGGLQMFDVPQILTNGTGDPVYTTQTLIMRLNDHLHSDDYGRSGALSVILFIVTGILSMIIYKFNTSKE